jgi:hypothetical protein
VSYTTGFERSQAEDKLNYNVTLFVLHDYMRKVAEGKRKWQEEEKERKKSSPSVLLALSSFVTP